MELKMSRIKPWSKGFRDVRRLLLTQFPRDELYPVWALRLITLKKNVDCTVFHEGDRFAGFYYLLLSDRTVFLLYSAVDPDLQSKGYGTAIQKALRERYAGREIVCHIEAPGKETPETEQPVRRLRFYERNGYAFTGYKTEDKGVRYWVMSTRGRDFDRESYEKLFRDMEGDKGVPELEWAGD